MFSHTPFSKKKRGKKKAEKRKTGLHTLAKDTVTKISLEHFIFLMIGLSATAIVADLEIT